MTAPWQKPFRGMQIDKAHPLARGLVCCLVLNEATGGTAFDLSGYGDHGTIIGADWAGDGLDLNGTSDYIDMGTNILVNPSAISMVVRAKADSLTVDQRLITRFGGATGVNAQFILWMDTGGAGDGWALAIRNSTDDQVTIGDDSINATTDFQTIVGTCENNGNAKIYVDGTESDSAAFSGQIHPGIVDLWIGAMDLETDQFFNGKIEYVYFYDRAISPEEVAYLHREPYAMFQQPISPALMYYEAAPPTGNPYWYYQMLRRRNI